MRYNLSYLFVILMLVGVTLDQIKLLEKCLTPASIGHIFFEMHMLSVRHMTGVKELGRSPERMRCRKHH